MKWLCSITLIFLTVSAQADLLFSVEHPVSTRTLEPIISAIEFSRNRDAEAQKLPVYMPIFDQFSTRTPFTLHCLPTMPDSEGNGCWVIVDGGKQPVGQTSINFKKRVFLSDLQSFLKGMNTVLKTDPNSVSDGDHKQLGNPFSLTRDAATHVYCASNGIAPNKKWKCTLFVSEHIK